MRSTLLFLLLIFGFVAIVSAWTKEDYEIFELASAVEAAEGEGTTFYSWLGVPSTASMNDIAKAYRKKSIVMHPDKNPKAKNIQKRFARLGVISKILRDPDTRERYDFFYKNGFPKWRGTGYYYSRFRPGLGSVLVFLVIITSGIQYMVQRMNQKRDLERIRSVIQSARRAAWGPKMVPLTGPRKVRIPLSGNGSAVVDEDSDFDDVPSRGRTLTVLVDGDYTFLIEDGEQHLLSGSMATSASLFNTWFISLIRGVISRVTSPKSTSSDSVHSSDKEETSDDETDGVGLDAANTATNGAVGMARQAAVKAGGRRRKVVRKR
jgi:curved DNA-binding protein CbpA